MFRKYEAGVSFAENTAQIVVLRVDKQPWRLCSVAEFRSKTISPTWFLQPLLERDVKIYRKVKKVSIAIDNEKLFQCVVPVDANLDHQAWREHLTWELTQFIPQESVKDYIPDPHVLVKKSVEGADDTLIIAAKRELIVQLEGELKKYRFRSGIIDSSFFGAQKCAMVTYPDVALQRLAIVGVYPRRVDVGVYYGGKLFDYRQVDITSPREVPPVVESALEQSPMESVCIYGFNIGSQLLEKLREKEGRSVFLLDAFKSLQNELDEPSALQFRGREHAFAPAVGIVMMKL